MRAIAISRSEGTRRTGQAVAVRSTSLVAALWWLLGTMPVVNCAQQEASAALGPVRLQVIDYAGVLPDHLRYAQDTADGLYGDAGIALEWVHPSEVNVSFGPAFDYSVMILAGEVAEVKAASLGIASRTALGGAPLDEGGGLLAYVFYSRIVDQARAGYLSAALLLGHVIAHELGHLLLGSDNHTVQGIMAPVWDLEHQLPREFTPSQLDAMHRRLTAIRVAER
jgi:hypothetical protein